LGGDLAYNFLGFPVDLDSSQLAAPKAA
jgi:hypothetical protein